MTAPRSSLRLGIRQIAIGGEGVLIELVQAPPDVIAAFAKGYPGLRAFAVFALACALGACGGGGGSDGGPPPVPGPQGDPAYRASGPPPLPAGCEGAARGGTLYNGAEVEPMIAVNPLNAANLVGVWQQDRWSNGGAAGLVAGVSFDGGRTWERRAAPFSRCTGGNAANGGDYERATDPWVSFGPDGTAWQVALAFSGDTFATGSANAILVSRSVDGGRSWSDPATLIRDGAGFFNDKETLTADPYDARYAYATWDRLSAGGGGPTYFTRTTDGGLTWETPRIVLDPGTRSQTINNQIVVLPDGTLVLYCTVFEGGNIARGRLAVRRSTDKGQSWSATNTVADMQPVGAADPVTGADVRDGANLGSIAVAPNGELVAVWQDSRFSAGARDGVAFSRSQDGGLTWSAPVQVNFAAGVPAFVPTVAVARDGTIGVTYYDFRNDTADPATLPTDYWLVRSVDGVTWTETHVAGPFDLAIAPNANGLFIGDYQALATIGGTFVPFYAQTNSGDLANRTDVFVSLVAPRSATADAAANVRTMRAVAVVPAAMTADAAQRVADTAARTIERRLQR